MLNHFSVVQSNKKRTLQCVFNVMVAGVGLEPTTSRV